MPTYVYACDSCGNQFEKFQSFKDEPLQSCPNCGNVVRRVFQPVGIVFKGSGWYITDSRKSDSATINSDDSSTKVEKPSSSDTATKSDAVAKSDTPAKNDTAAKSETKSSESKPATI